MLDSTLQELHPPTRRGLVDQAGVPPDDPYVHPGKSELIQELEVLLTAAAAQAGVLNSDDEDPLRLLAEAANLSHAEYESVAMAADGMSWEAIAKAQRVTEPRARRTAASGQRKLAQYVLNSRSDGFSPRLLRGH